MAFVIDEELKARLDGKVDFKLIEKKDKRMRLRNSKDPIYGVFDVLDNQPVSKLFNEFVKDIIFDVTNSIKNLAK